MNPYMTLLRRAGTKPWFAWFGRRVLTPLDTRLRGRRRSITTFGTTFPLGYLTTTGRRSGEPRTVPLLYVTTAAGVPAVVGTDFGAPTHPAWVLNLMADPRARWQGNPERAVAAREIFDPEYAELWGRFLDVWPGYQGYVERSRRRPLMFALESAPG